MHTLQLVIIVVKQINQVVHTVQEHTLFVIVVMDIMTTTALDIMIIYHVHYRVALVWRIDVTTFILIIYTGLGVVCVLAHVILVLSPPAQRVMLQEKITVVVQKLNLVQESTHIVPV